MKTLSYGVLVCFTLTGLVLSQSVQACSLVQINEDTGEELRQTLVDCVEPWPLLDGSPQVEVVATILGQVIENDATYLSPEAVADISTMVSVQDVDDFSVQQSLFLIQDGDYVLKDQSTQTTSLQIDQSGEYVLLTSITTAGADTDPPLLLSYTSLRTVVDYVLDWVLPKAYAQNPQPVVLLEQSVLRFTVEVMAEPEAQPPSVLFLPGIQASRLYKERSIIGEDRVWEPSITLGNDFFDLQMSSDGVSEEAIYTKSGDAIDVTQYIAGNVVVYDTFLQRLATEAQSGVIYDYTVLAYDWRYDVRDIVNTGIMTGAPGEQTVVFPITELLTLIEENPAKKVSIVAHSNGGLLAKAMLAKIEERCTAGEYDQCPLDFVDRLILVGSPQTGTPQAINQLLHGPPLSGIADAFVLQPVKFRGAAQHMPATYGLLPASTYMEAINEPMVTFIGNDGYVGSLRSAYPDGIGTVGELHDFLVGKRGRGFVGPGQLSLPLILNETLLQSGSDTNDVLADWQAPASVRVTELVGVGSLTTTGIRYETVYEPPCLTCPTLPLTKPIPQLSLYGDQTVTAQSATGYSGEKETFYVDLERYNTLAGEIRTDEILPAVHANLTEPADVQSLLFALVADAPIPESDYITTEQPNYDDQSYTTLSTHSPVVMLAEDSLGNQTGRIEESSEAQLLVEDIPGSRFFVIGSSSYLFVPDTATYTVSIVAYATGSFTMIVDENDGAGARTASTRVDTVPVQAGTVATLTHTADGFGTMQVDYDADGTLDQEWAVTGELLFTAAAEPKESETAIDSPSSDSTATRVADRGGESEMLLAAEPQATVLAQSVVPRTLITSLEQLQVALAQADSLTQDHITQLQHILTVIIAYNEQYVTS